MTLDLEVNEVEVKGLTSLASVTENPGHESPRSLRLRKEIKAMLLLRPRHHYGRIDKV
jgi:hypothetical protein